MINTNEKRKDMKPKNRDKHKEDLLIFKQAQDLCTYIMKGTQNSPKQFRFTYTTRLQNMSMDIVRDIYRANDIYVADVNEEGASSLMNQRLRLQRDSLSNIQLLMYFSHLAVQQKAITVKNYELISTMGSGIKGAIIAWRKSDQKRYENQRKL